MRCMQCVDTVLHLILPQPELITHIRIRVKGITRTLVLKESAYRWTCSFSSTPDSFLRANASFSLYDMTGRHPVGDEVTFWEESIDLYSETTPTVLPNNESADPTKTKGTFSFPFTLHLPSKVQAPGIGAAIFSLPPSFVLNGGAENRGMNEWASCRYVLHSTACLPTCPLTQLRLNEYYKILHQGDAGEERNPEGKRKARRPARVPASIQGATSVSRANDSDALWLQYDSWTAG